MQWNLTLHFTMCTIADYAANFACISSGKVVSYIERAIAKINYDFA